MAGNAPEKVRYRPEQGYLSVETSAFDKRAAQRLVKEDGVALTCAAAGGGNQWIAAALAEKIGVVETAAEFFKKRAGKAKGDGLMKFLRSAPDVALEAEDEIR